MKHWLSGLLIILLTLLLVNRFDLPEQLVLPPPPAASPTPSPISLIFAGDLMMDRHIRRTAERQGYDFILAPLTTLFNQTDLVIANLEGPITQNRSVSLNSQIGGPGNYTFTFDPAILPTLYKNQIRLVNLGNNHILNFGTAGLDSTKQYLNASQINYFGNDGYSDTRYKIINLKQKRLAFVNYNQFVKDGLQACLEDIATVKAQSDLVILYAHWDTEYLSRSQPATQNIAHQFIEAGVDLIIGSHPHVVQETEVYQQKTIYYSLGNFVFDQYFMPETQRGLLVKVVIDSQNNLSLFELPIQLKPNSQTSLLDH